MRTVYFATVTVTTVGYGDVSPGSTAGQLFTVLYILFGLSIVGSVISSFANEMIEKQQAAMLERVAEEDDGDPLTVEEKPHTFKIVMSLVMILFCVLVGAIFFMLNEEWAFLTAFYWSFVTTTTVGYGDLSLTEESSRNFSIFYILTSTMIVAAAIGNFSAVQMEKALDAKRKEMLSKKLSIEEVLAMDDSGDAKVDKGEFMAAFLVSLGLVSKEDCDPILARFDELDADGSGSLDHDDIEMLKEQERKKREEKARKRASQTAKRH